MATRKAAGAAAGRTVRVKQLRSGIGFTLKQKETLRSLGFKRLNQVVELPDNPAVRGMIYSVRHLVEVIAEGSGQGSVQGGAQGSTRGREGEA